MMCNKSAEDQGKETILSGIESGNIYREGADHSYRFSGDVTDACIDASRYASPSGIRLSIKVEILELLDRKDSLREKLKIAELDKENVLAAYLVIYQQYSLDDISSLLESKDEYFKSIGVGLAVISDNPQIIPSSNIEGLYKYFRSREIRANELNYFSADEFIKHSFQRMLGEERVIFTWMVNNLTSLVDINAVNIDEHSSFFVSLLRDNDYPNETHKALFSLCLKKSPSFIEEILKMRLDIDPFTKQHNYSRWLTEIRKFSFVASLRNSLPPEYSSEEVSSFDKRKLDLYRINRNDRSLGV